MIQSMGSQRVRHDSVTEQQQSLLLQVKESEVFHGLPFFFLCFLFLPLMIYTDSLLVGNLGSPKKPYF